MPGAGQHFERREWSWRGGGCRLLLLDKCEVLVHFRSGAGRCRYFLEFAAAENGLGSFSRWRWLLLRFAAAVLAQLIGRVDSGRRRGTAHQNRRALFLGGVEAFPALEYLDHRLSHILQLQPKPGPLRPRCGIRRLRTGIACARELRCLAERGASVHLNIYQNSDREAKALTSTSLENFSSSGIYFPPSSATICYGLTLPTYR